MFAGRLTSGAGSFDLVTKQPEASDSEEDMEKFAGNIFYGVYPLSFRTRTSTSLLRRRYDISLESSRCQWPGICISPENTRGGGDRGWLMHRGMGKGDTLLLLSLSLSLSLTIYLSLAGWNVGRERKKGRNFRATLFNRPDLPARTFLSGEWTSTSQ